MIWLEDCDERLVNIDNWDFLDYQTIEDEKTGKSIAAKIYLQDRKNKEHILGYLDIEDVPEILKKMSLGYQTHFYSLNSFLYNYMNDNEEFDDISIKDFDKQYEERILVINKLIGKRFIETQNKEK